MVTIVGLSTLSLAIISSVVFPIQLVACISPLALERLLDYTHVEVKSAAKGLSPAFIVMFASADTTM